MYQRMPPARPLLPRAIDNTTDSEPAAPAPAAAAAAPAGHAEPKKRAKEQRHEVKAIALESVAIMHRYKSMSNADITSRTLIDVKDELKKHHERLVQLQHQGLSDVPPAESAARNLRSSAVLFAGSASRTAAVFTASAGAIVPVGEGVVTAPAWGALGTIVGVGQGVNGGAAMVKSKFAKVPAAIVGAGIVGVVGGAVNFATPLVSIVPSIAKRGSLTRKAFRGVDRLPAARAHVAQKSMSTKELAAHTIRQIDYALNDVRTKFPEVNYKEEKAWMKDRYGVE